MYICLLGSCSYRLVIVVVGIVDYISEVFYF